MLHILCLWQRCRTYSDSTKLNAYIYWKIFLKPRLEASYVIYLSWKRFFSSSLICSAILLHAPAIALLRNELIMTCTFVFVFIWLCSHARICASVIPCKMLILLSMSSVCEHFSHRAFGQQPRHHIIPTMNLSRGVIVVTLWCLKMVWHAKNRNKNHSKHCTK